MSTFTVAVSLMSSPARRMEGLNGMTTTLFLRIASAISLMFMLGHTAGGLQKWSPMGDNDVLKAMTAVHFDVRGAIVLISTSSWASAGASACTC